MNLFEKLWGLFGGGSKTKPTTPVAPVANVVPAPAASTDKHASGLTGSAVEPRNDGHPVHPPAIPAASPTDRRRPRSDRTTVVVGFDFGTYSTKVLFRKRNDDVARVLTLGDPVPGYPSFASPSLVSLEQGRLWFGGEALAHTQGALYRSLKVRLLGPATEPDNEYPPGPCPDLLVAAYLTWAFRAVRNGIDRQYPDAGIRLNVAAPMDHLEDQKLKARYLQIVQAAWTIAFGRAPIPVTQGCRLDEIEDALHSLLSREVLGEDERKFDVLPETVTAIVSLSMNPRMMPGMYLIVDVGAGTTEISVNYSNEQGIDHRVVCYCDQTVMIGGDQFSRLSELPSKQQQDQCDSLASELAKRCAKVWALGRLKDAPNHFARQRWKSLTILLAGGGTRHPAVRGIFRNPSVFLDRLRQYQVECEVMSHSPTSVDLGSHNSAAADLPLLVVAHGLTRERQRWPEYFEPASVETLEATAAVEKPDSFWYVGGK